MKILTKLLLLAALLASAPGLAHATSVDELTAYLDGTRSLRADFFQLSLDPRGGPERVASGQVALQKPGRFRWDYTEPYRQLIVGDGQRVWQYDVDLEQVIVQPLSDTLGSTPLALLTGSKPVTESFRVVPQGSEQGLEWFLFTPLETVQDGFEDIRLGLRNGTLARLELQDALGQTTRLRFHDVRRNVPVAPELFNFQPPPEADVIGDG